MKQSFWLLMAMACLLITSKVGSQETRVRRVATVSQGNTQLNASGNNEATSFKRVHALAINVAGREMFLGSDIGLWRSRDGGRTWKKVAVSAKQPNLEVTAVASSQKQAGTIYIATRDAGIFASADDGTHWSQVNNGLGGLEVHGLAIDPNDGKLHAVVRNKGQEIYRSTNGGGKWSRVNGGPGQEIKFLSSVNIPTGMGGIFLYAGTVGGLQRSPDCF
jgi:photosystem II stability/assembly factor-like uncharacterized protein